MRYPTLIAGLWLGACGMAAAADLKAVDAWRAGMRAKSSVNSMRWCG
jgi:hypothetical protein